MNASLREQPDEFDARVHAFAQLHADQPTSSFAANIHARVDAIDVGTRFPITVMDRSDVGEAWVCSPCSAYGDYAVEELERFANSPAVVPLTALCRVLNRWLRAAQFNRAVTINNWLLSTNLYPPHSANIALALRDQTIERYPQHAVWFRSLNEQLNADWIGALTAAGFDLIPSRQVYLIDDAQAAIARHDNLRWDLRLLERTSLTRVRSGFSAHDFERMAELYAQLYVGKYSALNPQYTAHFLAAWYRAGLLELEGLRDPHGTLCAVVGVFRLESTLTAPIVGYDTALPQRLGLYRMLMASVVESAAESGAQINFSAGAAEFKRLRGAHASIEYSAVYSRHLPRARRRAIWTVRRLAERIGVPFMRKYSL